MATAGTNDWVFDVTAEDFEARVINTDATVVVDFWAPWCGPCQQIAPVLESLAEHYAGGLHVAKVNVDEQGQLAGAFGVRSIPYLVVFNDGQAVEQVVGVQPAPALREMLDRFVTPPADEPADAGAVAESAGDPADIDALASAFEAEPGNLELGRRLARSLLSDGRIADAADALSRLEDGTDESSELAGLRAEIEIARAAEGLDDRAALDAAVADAPDDPEALHARARVAAAQRDYDTALGDYLALMRSDRAFGDDAGRKGLVLLFDALGDDARVRDYRRRMASILH